MKKSFMLALSSIIVLMMLAGNRWTSTTPSTALNELNAQKELNAQIELNAQKELAGPFIGSSHGASTELERERNELSMLAMARSKAFLQFQCQTGGSKISSSGSWCQEYSDPTTGVHAQADKSLIARLADFFNGSRVASFGDGTGVFKKLLDQTRQLVVYDAFDGAPFCEQMTNGSVRFLDLSLPVYGLERYDWILSLEVAEHIPEQYETTYLDNLVRYATRGVVLSWATPHQMGSGHVNGRNISYVIDRMAERGLRHDPDASRQLAESATRFWFRRNINVYFRMK